MKQTVTPRHRLVLALAVSVAIGLAATGTAPAAAAPPLPTPTPTPPTTAPGPVLPSQTAPPSTLAVPPTTSAPTETATTLPTPTAAPARYVALGDSWPAGAAAGDLEPASGTCRRSAVAYPSLVARAAGETRAESRACSSRDPGSGNTQFSSLGPATRVVTATVGADAVGLGETGRACSSAARPADCDTAATRSEATLAQLPSSLDSSLADLRRRAPTATVVVVGYPRIAEGRACRLGPAGPSRAARLDAIVDRLDTILAERAGAAGMTFVDVRPAFAGRGVCSPEPWLTPLTGADPRTAGSATADGHAGGFAPPVLAEVRAALAEPASAQAAPSPSGPTRAEPGPLFTN